MSTVQHDVQNLIRRSKMFVPVNEGFKPSDDEVELARKVKNALDEAYARGEGSVSVEGRMYDVANMKHVTSLLARADALAKKEAEKEAAVEAAKN